MHVLLQDYLGTKVSRNPYVVQKVIDQGAEAR